MRLHCALRRILAVAAVPLLLTRISWAQVSARDSVSLTATAQALLDAVTSGDSAVWARHLAPEWFLSDEEGQRVTRKELLSALHPLPAGQQGKLTMANPHFVGGPGVIVMTYDALEEHHYYGQLIGTTYHTTDTYIRRGTRWLQIASQTTALPRAVDGRGLAPTLLRDYAGTYALTPDIRLILAVRDSGLSMARTGRDPQPLYALDDRIFVRHGVRGFWVFERDSSGTVVDLVNWRDNNPVVWHRQP